MSKNKPMSEFDRAFRAALHLELLRDGYNSQYLGLRRIYPLVEGKPCEELEDLYILAAKALEYFRGVQKAGRPKTDNPKPSTIRSRKNRANNKKQQK